MLNHKTLISYTRNENNCFTITNELLLNCCNKAGHWMGHFFRVPDDCFGSTTAWLSMVSSQSIRQLISHLAFSKAVARRPMVSVLSGWFFFVHSWSISRIISKVLLLLFMRNFLICSTVNPSSSPRCRYCNEILSAMASSKAGKTLTFFRRAYGRMRRAI